MDKDEDEIGIKNNLALYKYFSKKGTLNLQNENMIKTNVFFNNTLRKNKNNYLNCAEPYRPASKGKLLVMKIIKKNTYKKISLSNQTNN